MQYQIPTKIQGIPCQVVVDYEPPDLGYHGGATIDPPDDGYMDVLEVLNRRDQPIQWLEKKITPKDREQVYDDLMRHLWR